MENLPGKENEEIELSELNETSRRNLHRLLYRQECRIWLLAVSLPIGVLLLITETDRSKTEFENYCIQWLSAALAVFLAFWAGFPSQTLLAKLRKGSTRQEQTEIESKFENSWQSIWDFAPPLILPILFFFGLLFFRYLAER